MDDAGLFAELYPTLRRFAAAVSSLGVDQDDLVQEAVARTLRRRPLRSLVGSTVTITAEHLTPHAAGVDIGLCRTGSRDGSCRYDPSSMERSADGDGRLVVTFTLRSGTIDEPTLDPANPETIDCTAAAGACSFSIFPMEGRPSRTRPSRSSSSVDPRRSTPGARPGPPPARDVGAEVGRVGRRPSTRRGRSPRARRGAATRR